MDSKTLNLVSTLRDLQVSLNYYRYFCFSTFILSGSKDCNLDSVFGGKEASFLLVIMMSYTINTRLQVNDYNFYFYCYTKIDCHLTNSRAAYPIIYRKTERFVRWFLLAQGMSWDRRKITSLRGSVLSGFFYIFVRLGLKNQGLHE